MKKVLFTIGSLGLGGAESQMILLIKKLLDQGFQCEVAVLDAAGPLRSRLDELGVPVHDLDYRPKASFPGKIVQLSRTMFRLWSIAFSYKPDVLHAFLPLTNFMGAIAGRLAGTDLIITSRRALGTHQNNHPLWAVIDRIANRLSSHVIVNSKAVGLDTIARDGVAPEKLVRIYNGLDFAVYDEQAKDADHLRQALGLDEDTIGILLVGNLITYKGYQDLLQAIGKLGPDRRRMRFFIVGRDDGIGANLKRQVDKLNIGEQIMFLGQRDDVPRLMAIMDLFVMPSHEEGFSNALLEAMAAGLPIIATRVGGNPEALADGLYGDLVPPHDPAALAEAIGKIVTAPNQARKIGKKAAQHVRSKYGADVMVQSYIALYESERPARYRPPGISCPLPGTPWTSDN